MTDEEYAAARPVIEMAQRLHTGLHGKLIEKGVQPIDALIAATYSAHHLAAGIHSGNGFAAVEWMRDALDTIERQLLPAPRGR